MDAIILNERDNVATALRALPKGTVANIEGGTMTTMNIIEDIPLLHKVTLVDLAVGDLVHKYGEVIGAVTQGAAAGSLVHVHNIRSRRAQRPRSAT